MIFITGDTHGEFSRFCRVNFPKQDELTKDDYVIIAGDFGGIWEPDSESDAERVKLDWLEKLPFTTLFVDGNHENFDRLAQYPEIEWNGGRVHQVRPSVLHLERGYVFNLEGQKVFTFGGAESTDVEGGILDPADPEYTNKLHEVISDYAPFRVKGVSWWEQELPTDEEMQRGLENLRNVDGQVDLIITHCASSSTQAVISQRKPNKLTDYFEQIKREVHYKDWYFGHYHQTRDLRAGEHAIYSEIRRWK